ncbi:MAG TPA: tetratricopeptide repeat protein [Pyrinomonadaceae bacterium]|jgi:Tetratricopeptide repeat.|nr:tetratricopeptide repeat protein [Pyrinomonadaceae bacterium]
MFCNTLTARFSHLLFAFALISLAAFLTNAQNSLGVAQPRHSVSVLDSTKEQDGLVGSVRRVKTETAKVEMKEGQLVEGPLQILELTTYGIKGNRIENISYPGTDPMVGKEEYKYDAHGNITEMTLRDERGAIVAREAYNYEFDNVGNWTKMTTSLLLFENGQIKREPIESTYRTITYYFDDNIAKIVDSPSPSAVRIALPSAVGAVTDLDAPQLKVKYRQIEETSTTEASIGEAPALLVRRLVSRPVKVALDTKTVATSTTKESISTTKPQVIDRTPEARDSKPESFVETRSRVDQPKVSEAPKASSTSSRVEAVEGAAIKTSPAEDSPQKVAYNLYEKGRVSLDGGDFEAAVGAFLMSVKLEPSAEAYLNLGFAYLRLDKNNDASKAFRQSTKLNPDVAEAHYALGLTSYRLKRFADARDAFKRATVLEPRMAKAHYGLGVTYIELGQPDASVNELRILERLDKNLAKQLSGSSPRLKDPCRNSMICQ